MGIVESKRDADGDSPLEHAYHDELPVDLGERVGKPEPTEHPARDARAALVHRTR